MYPQGPQQPPYGGYPQQPPGGGYPQPPPYGGGYPQPPQKSGMSGLMIGLIIGGIVLVLGFGGCLVALFVVGAAVSAEEKDAPVGTQTEDPIHEDPADLKTTTGVSRSIEKALRAKGLPVTSLTCPPQNSGTFECELTVASGDKAAMQVTVANGDINYHVKDVAILSGAKLDELFQSSAGKTDKGLRVPCFTGMLMKKVGGTFTCDVNRGVSRVGAVDVTVKTEDGHVAMKYSYKK